MNRRIMESVLTLAFTMGAAVSPGSASTMFALVDTGELFASDDDGITWTVEAALPVSDAVALQVHQMIVIGPQCLAVAAAEQSVARLFEQGGVPSIAQAQLVRAYLQILHEFDRRLQLGARVGQGEKLPHDQRRDATRDSEVSELQPGELRAPIRCLDGGIEESVDEDSLDSTLVLDADRHVACVEASRDEAGQDGPRPAGAAGEDRFHALALIGRCPFVDQEDLRPVSLDHVLRTIVGDHRVHALKRHAPEVAGRRPGG